MNVQMNFESSATNTEYDGVLKQAKETAYTLHRRFDRFGRLVGDENMEKLFRAHVCIIGLGGVGSWAAESLVRSGVGKVSLVDFDEICITNANRQLHALQGLVGRKKAEVMAERLRKVNPQAQVVEHVKFYNEETSQEILADRPDFVLDCIDNLTAKSHLLALCRDQKIPVITATGAGARMDPLSVQLVDLSESHTDPMAAQLRKILRTRHNFPREGSFDLPCVFSAEVPSEPVQLHYDKGQGFKCVCPQGQNNLHSCEHRNVIYGNASFVTGTFGLVMASWVVRKIVGASV
jgi:tRNA A37 threonylcarbamoyladenosine dehydratase